MLKYRHNDKYDAKLMDIDQIKFTSKKEAAHYLNLSRRKLDKEVKYFLRQVPFDLGKNGVYFCDFLVVWADDSVSFEDAKSPMNSYVIGQKTLAEEKYHVKINQI